MEGENLAAGVSPRKKKKIYKNIYKMREEENGVKERRRETWRDADG